MALLYTVNITVKTNTDFGRIGRRCPRKGKTMTVEHIIVGATGVGYLIVGVLQWIKGEVSNGMIWTGYAFAQVGLWLNLK